MPTTAACHGNRAPASARVRRRWRRKERDALAAAAAAKETANAPQTARDVGPGLGVDHAAGLPIEKRDAHDAVRDHEHKTKSDRPSSPPSPPDSTELQSQKSRAQGHVFDHSQDRASGHGIGRRDTILNSDWPSVPPSPPNRIKPCLSASSTSAEVVEALLPGHPVAANLPRRTASVCSSYERKRPTIGPMI